MKLCKCGCGQELTIKAWHGYKNRKLPDYLRGHNKFGDKASDELRQKLSEAHKGQKSGNKGKIASAETIERLRIAHLGQRSRNGCKHKPESIEKMRASHAGKTASEETKIRMAGAMKRKWQSQEFAEKMIRSWRLKPNKKEKILMAILDSMYPGEWQFVGDGQIVIAGKCPDFINVNGQKKIIELFGDYWHRGQDPQDRQNVFSPFGYKTLVLWERELKDTDSMKEKIERFCSYEN